MKTTEQHITVQHCTHRTSGADLICCRLAANVSQDKTSHFAISEWSLQNSLSCDWVLCPKLPCMCTACIVLVGLGVVEQGSKAGEAAAETAASTGTACSVLGVRTQGEAQNVSM